MKITNENTLGGKKKIKSTESYASNEKPQQMRMKPNGEVRKAAGCENCLLCRRRVGSVQLTGQICQQLLAYLEADHILPVQPEGKILQNKNWLFLSHHAVVFPLQQGPTITCPETTTSQVLFRHPRVWFKGRHIPTDNVSNSEPDAPAFQTAVNLRKGLT